MNFPKYMFVREIIEFEVRSLKNVVKVKIHKKVSISLKLIKNRLVELTYYCSRTTLCIRMTLEVI